MLGIRYPKDDYFSLQLGHLCFKLFKVFLFFDGFLFEFAYFILFFCGLLLEKFFHLFGLFLVTR